MVAFGNHWRWPAPLYNLYFDSFLLICTSFVVKTRGIVCVVYPLSCLANYRDPCKRCVLAQPLINYSSCLVPKPSQKCQCQKLALCSLSKVSGNSFQQISDSYTLKDEYHHCFTTTSDATIMVSHKYPIIGKQVAFTHPIQQVTIATIHSVKSVSQVAHHARAYIPVYVA